MAGMDALAHFDVGNHDTARTRRLGPSVGLMTVAIRTIPTRTATEFPICTGLSTLVSDHRRPDATTAPRPHPQRTTMPNHGFVAITMIPASFIH